MRAGQGRATWRKAAAVLAVALLAACIGGDDGDGGSDGPSSGEAPAGTMRLGIGGSLVVDPVQASLASTSDLMVIDLLHDGLTDVDEAGAPQPALAERWRGNKTSTAFNFALRSDATFASGRQVTPQDVIASLERIIATGDSSLAALSLESIKGYRAFVDGKAEHVSGLTAPNARTVHIDLTIPLSVLPVILSNPLLSVVDAATIEGDLGDLDLSGSWVVASAEDDDLVVDNRSSDASVKHVELRSHDDANDAYEAFEDGDVDWAEVPADQVDDAVEAHSDAAFAPFQAELFFGMNLSSAALKSEPLRQAIAVAINRDAIAEEVYADLADPLTTVVPAGIAGHNPERCGDCAYDAGRAKDIIAFAFSGKKVPTVHIDFDESSVQEAMAEMVSADLTAAGIPNELRPKSLDDYKAFVVSGDQELFSFGWIGAYRSPDAYLAPLFGSAANDNLTHYRSERVDDLLARARASTNATENAKAWSAAERTVLEDYVVVPIVQFRSQVVVAGRVEGFAHAVDGTVDWARVTVAS